MACAEYLIHIGNRDSYGVLNLNRLIIRNFNGLTWIELGLFEDGGLTNPSYIIKIWEHAWNSALSKIRVSNICDKDGGNCKQVFALSTWSQITISGNIGAVCTKEGDDTLKCTTSLASLTPWNWTIKITQGWVEKWSFKLNQSTGLTIDLDTWSNITVSGTNGYLCTKLSDNSLKCSTDPANLIPWNGQITIKQWTNTWSFNLNDSGDQTLTLATWGGTYTWVTMNGYNTNSNNYCVAVDANTIECKSSGGSGSVGESMSYWALTNNKYCKYIAATANNPNGSIVCNYDAEGWSWGDSLWITGTSVPTGPNTSYNIWNHIRPFNDNYNLYFSDNTTFYHGWTVKFQKAWFNAASSPVQFDAKGARFWFMGENAYSGAWVGINGWMLVLWQNGCNDNKISIFASGVLQSANYEILWSNRLFVWVQDKWYIYFSDSATKKSVWINTTSTDYATLTVNGWIKIWNNCESNTCNANNVWRIIYYETGDVGLFVGCKKKSSTEYGRYRLDGSQIASGNIPNNALCNVQVPYSTAQYDEVYPSRCR